MTYNLLADQYASQEHSQKVLFKHVPLGLLDIEYRKQLVLHQLLASNADVMCLQVRRRLIAPACVHNFHALTCKFHFMLARLYSLHAQGCLLMPWWRAFCRRSTARC